MKLKTLLLALLFFSCLKDKQDYACKESLTIPITGTLTITVVINSTLNDATYDQKDAYEKANNCHCVPVICPKY